MPDLRAHGAWINPPALPITSSNFHAVHALKRTHTHTHSPTLSLPPLPPSASPRYSWERTGASQTGDGRQGGRHSTQSDPRRRPSRIGPRHACKNTHEQIWRDWVSHARTHTHFEKGMEQDFSSCMLLMTALLLLVLWFLPCYLNCILKFLFCLWLLMSSKSIYLSVYACMCVYFEVSSALSTSWSLLNSSFTRSATAVLQHCLIILLKSPMPALCFLT